MPKEHCCWFDLLSVSRADRRVCRLCWRGFSRSIRPACMPLLLHSSSAVLPLQLLLIPALHCWQTHMCTFKRKSCCSVHDRPALCNVDSCFLGSPVYHQASRPVNTKRCSLPLSFLTPALPTAGVAGGAGWRDTRPCAGTVPPDVRLQSHPEGTRGPGSGTAAHGGEGAAGAGHAVCA